MTLDYTFLTAIVGVIVLLVKLVDKLFEFILDKMRGRAFVTEDDLKKIDDIHQISKLHYNICNRTDADGVPLCYVPRTFIESHASMKDTLTEIANIQRDIGHTQQDISKTLGRVVEILDNIDKRHLLLEQKLEQK